MIVEECNRLVIKLNATSTYNYDAEYNGIHFTFCDQITRIVGHTYKILPDGFHLNGKSFCFETPEPLSAIRSIMKSVDPGSLEINNEVIQVIKELTKEVKTLRHVFAQSKLVD